MLRRGVVAEYSSRNCLLQCFHLLPVGVDAVRILEVYFMKYQVAGGEPLRAQFRLFQYGVERLGIFGVPGVPEALPACGEFEADCSVGKYVVIPAAFDGQGVQNKRDPRLQTLNVHMICQVWE